MDDDLLTTVVRSAKPPKFSQAQIDAAVAQIGELEGRKSDPSKIKASTFFAKPKRMPGVDDLDFRDVQVVDTALADLQRSTKYLDRARLVWHVENPGVPSEPSPFTDHPIVMQTDDGLVIVDGQHRLAALVLLGAESWPCWQIPSE